MARCGRRRGGRWGGCSTAGCRARPSRGCGAMCAGGVLVAFRSPILPSRGVQSGARLPRRGSRIPAILGAAIAVFAGRPSWTKVRASWFVCLGSCASRRRVRGSASVHSPARSGRGRLLAKAAAWSDSMRSPRTPCWLEYRTHMPCGGRPAARATASCASAAGGGRTRVAWDVWMEPGPPACGCAYDGSRVRRAQPLGGTYIVAEAPPESVRTSLAGEARGYCGRPGARSFAAVRYERSKPARCVAVERLVVDGRARRCERVRVGPDPRARTRARSTTGSTPRPAALALCPLIVLLWTVPARRGKRLRVHGQWRCRPIRCFATTLPESVRP